MGDKDLGNGLLLRWVKPEDVQKVANAMVDVFSPPGKQVEVLRGWWLRYANGYGGYMKSSDVVVIIDTKKEGDPVVAFTSYWQEKHAYEGIPYGVARPEFVGVLPDPDYRGKRFQQHIMDALHARAKVDNNLVQVISGIAWYYRQFGYEYALEFGENVQVWLNAIPELKKDEQEFINYRRATLDDVDTIVEIDLAQLENSHITIPLAKEWLISQINDYDDSKNNENQPVLRHVLMFEDASDNTVGYAVIPTLDDGLSFRAYVGVYSMGFIRGIDTKTALSSAMRQIVQFAKTTVDEEKFTRYKSLAFYLSQWHPVVEAIHPEMRSFINIAFEGSHYYVRVPDLTKFVQHILPALNRRLEQSSTHHNYTGVVKISNYTPRYPGFELKIENGIIVGVTEFIKSEQFRDRTIAYFPPYSFLQVLFGMRSIQELKHIVPDVVMEHDSKLLLDVIFPKRKSIIPHLM